MAPSVKTFFLPCRWPNISTISVMDSAFLLWLFIRWSNTANFVWNLIYIILDSWHKKRVPRAAHRRATFGSLSPFPPKITFCQNLWHEVMSTEESRWILGIDQTLVFKNCLLSSTKHLYIFEHLWPYEAQISRIVGASDSQTICIFANLRDIRGQNRLYICKSPGYFQISYIFRA